uniref:Uncharacterized protein n=1 Tax=Trypanosoma vivax (strain Y486) TaxID=1055687 RepID=G0UAR6_TRYVY|nr:hypothetical protein TVY486_1103860 [Trypanosoma vivax Y486]
MDCAGMGVIVSCSPLSSYAMLIVRVSHGFPLVASRQPRRELNTGQCSHAYAHFPRALLLRIKIYFAHIFNCSYIFHIFLHLNLFVYFCIQFIFPVVKENCGFGILPYVEEEKENTSLGFSLASYRSAAEHSTLRLFVLVAVGDYLVSLRGRPELAPGR